MYFNGDKLFLVAEQDYSQSMGYCFVTKEGKVIAIDGGTENEASELKNYLLKNGGRVDAWFITHAHSDHINAVTCLLNDSEIKIDKLYYNFPDINWLSETEPDEERHIKAFLKAAEKSSAQNVKINKGCVYKFDGIEISVLTNPDTDYKTRVINNSSIVLGVKTKGKSILFLGDLEKEAGRRLIDSYKDLHYDIVQMAHHGQCGVNKAVYERIMPEICLWNTPLWLWDNDNGNGYNSGSWTTLETRRWMDELGVKKHIVSKDGSAEIF